MKLRWLMIPGCLLIAACGDPATNETARDKTANEAIARMDPGAEANVELKTPSERLEAIKSQHKKARDEFMVAFREAPEADRSKLVEEKYPKAENYAKAFMELAAEHPEDEAALDSLIWVARYVRSGDDANMAYEILFADHLENEKIKDICFSLSFSPPSHEIEERLNRILEDSPYDSVKAAATYASAKYHESVESAKKFVAENPDSKRFETASMAYIEAYEPQSQLIETLYQTLISDYGEFKLSEHSKLNYRAMAEGALFEMNNLSIGQTAPDIEDEDLDGISFKLSDYRGKVIVLDFWGDW